MNGGQNHDHCLCCRNLRKCNFVAEEDKRFAPPTILSHHCLLSCPSSHYYGEVENDMSVRHQAEYRHLLCDTPSEADFDYLGQSTKGDLNLNLGIDDGEVGLEGPIEEVARMEAQEAEHLLNHLGIPDPFSARYSPRGIFCSRTLNLRSISVIGYDMDYTLMHYNVMAWEGRAYDYCMDNLRNMGFPVEGLAFDPELVIRGLVIDKEKGNLVKADRFGYVKRAMHGTRMLSTQRVSEMYGRELVDLRKESRWEFLNTLFSVSEAVAYMQMVDRYDEGAIAADLGPLDYKGLYKAVGKALFRAHVEGQLKSEIMSKPELFVEPDPELPLALLDQKEAGKRLLLITNSDYHYTEKMMQHSFNRFLPNDMSWRDLFDMVIVSARKPEFFQMSHPMYEVVTGEGGLYSGGSAQMIENSLGVHGDEILYVGDHIYTDVSQSKVHLRWRTALICRELEDEYSALVRSRGHRATLIELINQKEVVGDLFNQLRLALQRRSKGTSSSGPFPFYTVPQCETMLCKLISIETGFSVWAIVSRFTGYQQELPIFKAMQLKHVFFPHLICLRPEKMAIIRIFTFTIKAWTCFKLRAYVSIVSEFGLGFKTMALIFSQVGLPFTSRSVGQKPFDEAN
ncbi:UNVERIFIED_CONTAM: 5'-nucleotidase domain-containing protein 3 [Sesamum calycinum]|uniref:5'-nucleotidase domain-containing protein 3 n=1 Tax=Sesamum calycinum TaxID=2727403 RepID=A0AAW2RP73_9LAMI